MNDLPRDVHELIVRHGGSVDTSTAERAGVSPRRLRNLAARGSLVRLTQGCYTVAEAVDGVNEWQRFELKARAFALSVLDGYLTGWGAAVAREFPTLGRPPSAPTVIRPKGSPAGTSANQRGRITVATLPREHRFLIGKLRLVSKAWSAVDLARTTRLPDSLVVADAMAAQGVMLRDILAHMSGWVGINRARWVVNQADPASESPLETLGRFGFLEYDLPLSVANAWVGRDRPERRVDGLLPWHWWAWEGDGALKYDNREDASQIVKEQNDREFDLRRLGLDFLRYGWSDVYPSRAPFIGKARAMFADHPAQSTPVRWWKHVPGKGPVEPQPQDWPSVCPSGIVLPAGWNRDSRE